MHATKRMISAACFPLEPEDDILRHKKRCNSRQICVLVQYPYHWHIVSQYSLHCTVSPNIHHDCNLSYRNPSS